MPDQPSQNDPPAAAMNFRERFCQASECPAEEFERRVLSLCVHSRHPTLARLLFQVDKENFQADLEMIRLLGRCSSYAEFKTELEAWRSSHPSKGYLRKQLRLRASGKNLLKLASRIFRGPGYYGFSSHRSRRHRSKGGGGASHR
jgi:hypothetical protein